MKEGKGRAGEKFAAEFAAGFAAETVAEFAARFAGSMGITVYGCERDEAAHFRRLAPCFGVRPVLVSDALSVANAGLALGNRCISVGHKTEVSAAAIFSLRNAGVKYISTRSVGLNHIDTSAAQKMGLAVGNVEYAPDSVADHCLMLILMAVRRAKSIVCSLQENDFRLDGVRSKAIRDMTVGVIGTGHIGRAVIKRLRGFDCRILAYSHNHNARAEYVNLDTLLQNSDIVTLHLPLKADTQHIIGQEQIGKMKPGAFLINTARGALVDTAALVNALEKGSLGGAALDVVEGEEGIFYFDRRHRPIDNQLLLKLQNMANVIITPHSAYYTEQVLEDTVQKTIKNCLDFERRLTTKVTSSAAQGARARAGQCLSGASADG
jgi:D-specific alpha-keto acid dehydrogenase